MSITLEIDRKSRLAGVPISVNGESGFIFTLDSGAIATTLGLEAAERLGLEVYSEPRTAPAFAGGLPAKYTTIGVLRIGSLDFKDEEVLVMDLSRMRRGNVRAGVLGHSMLKTCVMLLDYASRSLILTRDSEEAHDIDWSDFKYVEDSHLVTLPTRVNGSKPYDFVLDTGAGSTVVTPKLAEALGLDVQSVHGIARGLAGDTELKMTTIQELSVNQLNLHDVRAAVIDLGHVSPRGSSIEYGILGVNFLSQCGFAIDYPRRKYGLESRPPSE